jgi:hypothetical protein
MNVGDKCQYRDWASPDWKHGTILAILGSINAQSYVIAGTGHASGELVTKSSHYVIHAPGSDQ